MASPTPLSPEWWQIFHRLRPIVFGKDYRYWDASTMYYDDMDFLNDFLFRGKTFIVIGGKVGSPNDTYRTPRSLCAFFSLRSGIKVDKRVQIGHVVDHFLGGIRTNIYHFPAIDARETSAEVEDKSHEAGLAIEVPENELARRAAELVQDPIFQQADAVVINYNLAIPTAENIPFDTFLKYIGLREHRETGAISAICNAIRDLPERKRPDMRIVVLETSLFSQARADQDISDAEAARSSFKQNLKNTADIELSFITTYFDPPTLPVDDEQWRHGLNEFFTERFRNEENKSFAADLARIIAFGEAGPTPEQEDELYDQVMEAFLKTRAILDRGPGRFNVRTRQEFIASCHMDDQPSGRAEIQDDKNFDAPHEVVDGGGDQEMTDAAGPSTETPDQEMQDVAGSSTAATGKVTPLLGKVAVVLDSGRDDGVTEACSLELARLGASVAVTYVPDHAGACEEMVLKLIRDIRAAGGVATMVQGLPFRSEKYSCAELETDIYIGELMDLVLNEFGAKKVDCIVNNVGWKYSLVGNGPGPENDIENWRLINRDSIRNILALTYAVEHCVEKDLLSDSARIIHIAGMAANPSPKMMFGAVWWDYLFSLMERWSCYLLNASRPKTVDDPVKLFSAVIPGLVMDDAERPSSEQQKKAWWETLSNGIMKVL